MLLKHVGYKPTGSPNTGDFNIRKGLSLKNKDLPKYMERNEKGLSLKYKDLPKFMERNEKGLSIKLKNVPKIFRKE